MQSPILAAWGVRPLRSQELRLRQKSSLREFQQVGPDRRPPQAEIGREST
jgi:hypothetical protein